MTPIFGCPRPPLMSHPHHQMNFRGTFECNRRVATVSMGFDGYSWQANGVGFRPEASPCRMTAVVSLFYSVRRCYQPQDTLFLTRSREVRNLWFKSYVVMGHLLRDARLLCSAWSRALQIEVPTFSVYMCDQIFVRQRTYSSTKTKYDDQSASIPACGMAIWLVPWSNVAKIGSDFHCVWTPSLPQLHLTSRSKNDCTVLFYGRLSKFKVLLNFSKFGPPNKCGTKVRFFAASDSMTFSRTHTPRPPPPPP